jgi:hypothetical protein
MKPLILAAAFMLAATAASAQNSFTIVSNGETVGKCIYTFDQTKNGFKISSRIYARVTPPQRASDINTTPLANNRLIDIQQTHSYKLDSAYAYTGGTIQDQNSQMNNGISPNKQYTQLIFTHVQAGIAGQSSWVDLQAGYIVLPDYDVSAIQALVLMAAIHPTPNNIYFLIVPAANLRGSPLAGQALWTTASDTAGTFAGKAVNLHHYTIRCGKESYDLYADTTNTLMEADLSTPDAKYIRNGFALSSAH